MTAREWGTTLSHLLTGVQGWTTYDRLLVLALTVHDGEVCPSGAGPTHYIDECDADTTDIEPEPVERTCVYLVEQERWQDERAQDKNPEKGVLMGLRDARLAPVAEPESSLPS